MLAEALPADWPLARIDPVLRALMRAGAAELAMAEGPPAKVVINEYLDVARGFFTGAEPGWRMQCWIDWPGCCGRLSSAPSGRDLTEPAVRFYPPGCDLVGRFT